MGFLGFWAVRKQKSWVVWGFCGGGWLPTQFTYKDPYVTKQVQPTAQVSNQTDQPAEAPPT